HFEVVGVERAERIPFAVCVADQLLSRYQHLLASIHISRGSYGEDAWREVRRCLVPSAHAQSVVPIHACPCNSVREMPSNGLLPFPLLLENNRTHRTDRRASLLRRGLRLHAWRKCSAHARRGRAVRFGANRVGAQCASTSR